MVASGVTVCGCGIWEPYSTFSDCLKTSVAPGLDPCIEPVFCEEFCGEVTPVLLYFVPFVDYSLLWYVCLSFLYFGRIIYVVIFTFSFNTAFAVEHTHYRLTTMVLPMRTSHAWRNFIHKAPSLKSLRNTITIKTGLEGNDSWAYYIVMFIVRYCYSIQIMKIVSNSKSTKFHQPGVCSPIIYSKHFIRMHFSSQNSVYKVFKRP